MRKHWLLSGICFLAANAVLAGTPEDIYKPGTVLFEGKKGWKVSKILHLIDAEAMGRIVEDEITVSVHTLHDPEMGSPDIQSVQKRKYVEMRVKGGWFSWLRKNWRIEDVGMELDYRDSSGKSFSHDSAPHGGPRSFWFLRPGRISPISMNIRDFSVAEKLPASPFVPIRVFPALLIKAGQKMGRVILPNFYISALRLGH